MIEPSGSGADCGETSVAVRVRGLQKSYGEVRAVDGLDLDVERGEIFAVLGPNGAGKSTTVEILEGFRSRDDGEVSVLGEDPANAGRSWRARIGVVLQESRDLTDLTVAETVRATAAYYPNPRNPAEVIAAVGLEGKTNARVRGLSGGMRRRLDVALGIVGRPELLFLDEPTTGFDPEVRRAFWELVRSLQDGGTTILLTTHYLDEAAALADRVAVIKQGQVIALGTPDSLGGPQARIPIVSWRDDDGTLHQQRTEVPTAFVADLIEQRSGATHRVVEIDQLSITRPTLEDVYLNLISEGGAR